MRGMELLGEGVAEEATVETTTIMVVDDVGMVMVLLAKQLHHQLQLQATMAA